MALTKVGGGLLQSPLNVGVITATSFNGVGANFSGVVTATSFNGVGANFSGVVTATSFVGDGSGLSGVTTNYYKGEVFGYDNVLDSDINITSSYKTAVIQVDRDLTVDIENGTTITVDDGCYLNIVDV